MLEPMLSTEALLKEALLATLRKTRTRLERMELWELPRASVLRDVRAKQAERAQLAR